MNAIASICAEEKKKKRKENERDWIGFQSKEKEKALLTIAL